MLSILNDIKRLFFVHKCVSCREILSYKSFDDAFCPECRLAFEVSKTQNCPKCFHSACECVCQPELLSRNGSLCLRKLFFYSSNKSGDVQNKLIYFLKRNSNKRGFAFCAEQLWKMIKEELSSLEIYAPEENVFIVNVPRSKKSVRQYGFDQSQQICKYISTISGVPYVNALLRRRGGKEQKKLNATQRRKNMEGLIYSNNKASDMVKGRYAVLIDDVVTTGSSMAVCLNALRKMQVNGVICVALASDEKNKGIR